MAQSRAADFCKKKRSVNEIFTDLFSLPISPQPLLRRRISLCRNRTSGIRDGAFSFHGTAGIRRDPGQSISNWHVSCRGALWSFCFSEPAYWHLLTYGQYFFVYLVNLSEKNLSTQTLYVATLLLSRKRTFFYNWQWGNDR